MRHLLCSVNVVYTVYKMVRKEKTKIKISGGSSFSHTPSFDVCDEFITCSKLLLHSLLFSNNVYASQLNVQFSHLILYRVIS